MRLAIIGPGAMGTMLAVMISRVAGVSTWLVDHNCARAARLAARPLSLELANGSLIETDEVRVTAVPEGPFDFIILAVKSGDTGAALSLSAAVIAADGVVISLANGISHLDPILSWPGPGYAAVGVTAMGATMLAPGRVRFGGAGITTIGLAGEWFPGPAHGRLAQLAVLFDRAGIRVQVSDHIDQAVWNKLLVNVGINGLSAIHGCCNGILAENPDLAADLAAAVREAAAVGERLGFLFADDPVARTLEVCRDTAGNISSMLQDIRGNRKTEIMAINGAVVRMADELAIPVPVNRRIVRQVLDLEKSLTISTA